MGNIVRSFSITTTSSILTPGQGGMDEDTWFLSPARLVAPGLVSYSLTEYQAMLTQMLTLGRQRGQRGVSPSLPLFTEGYEP